MRYKLRMDTVSSVFLNDAERRFNNLAVNGWKFAGTVRTVDSGEEVQVWEVPSDVVTEEVDNSTKMH